MFRPRVMMAHRELWVHASFIFFASLLESVLLAAIQRLAWYLGSSPSLRSVFNVFFHVLCDQVHRCTIWE